jgi:hypothetical protein
MSYTDGFSSLQHMGQIKILFCLSYPTCLLVFIDWLVVVKYMLEVRGTAQFLLTHQLAMLKLLI